MVGLVVDGVLLILKSHSDAAARVAEVGAATRSAVGAASSAAAVLDKPALESHAAADRDGESATAMRSDSAGSSASDIAASRD